MEMYKRAVTCKNEVKLHLKSLGHLKCCSDRPSCSKEGKRLNHVMNGNKFVDEKVYRVCDQFVKKRTLLARTLEKANRPSV